MSDKADDISQAERRRIMAEDRRAKTYFGQAQHTVGGRYAKVHSTSVTGSSPTSYPAQPSTSPWHHDACPPEPPLGFSVEEMEPVGEPHERTASATSSSVKAGDDVRRVRRRGIRRI